MFRFVFFFLLLVAVFGASFYYLFSGKSISAESSEIPASRSAQTASSTEAEQPNPAQQPTQNGPLWAQRCDKEQHCEVFQRLQIVKTGQRLVEFAVGFPKDSPNAKIGIILPHGLLLSEGVTLKLGEQILFKAPIRTCAEGGCISIVELEKDKIDTLKMNKEMTLSIKDPSGKTINIVMSLEGFAKALSQL